MKIQPILPLGALLAIFALLFGITAFFVINNKVNRLDKFGTMMRLTVIYFLAFMVGIRPCMVESQYEFATKNLDVLFVIDTTISMWAQDYKDTSHSRMTGVSNDVNYILSELAGSNFGLVTFDDTSHVLAPFTQDMEYIRDLIDTFSIPDSYYAKGSDLSIPYQNVESLLLSSQKKENRKCIVFYISDGEITNGRELKSYSELAQYIDNGVVMGYGSSKGGRMKDGYSYVYDYSTHKDAVSYINEDNLRKIAEDLGLEYVNMNNGNESLKGRIQIIKESSKTIIENGQGAEITRDLYYFFAIPLVIMIFFELCMVARRGRL